jgi:hypothetical protein
MSLVASTAFQYNAAVQPRSFIALGCLAREEIDDDLLYQILVALRGALTMFEDNECHLIVSIIMALCNVIGGLPPSSRYLKLIFWLAFSLIQIGHMNIFHAALNLLEVTLKTLDTVGSFEKENATKWLMKARIPLKDVLLPLENAVGIHFRADFAFAIGVNLMKGIKETLTKDQTSSVLETFLEVNSKHRGVSEKVQVDQLGFIIPLLSSADHLSQLFWMSGVSPSEVDLNKLDGLGTPTGEKAKIVFEHLTIPDPSMATLAISMMITILESTSYEHESSFVYSFLAEAANEMPDIFMIL